MEITMISNEKIIEAVLRSIPYPDQMRDFDLSNECSVRFTWRGSRFRVSDTGYAEESSNHCLSGSNASILLTALVQGSMGHMARDELTVQAAP